MAATLVKMFYNNNFTLLNYVSGPPNDSDLWKRIVNDDYRAFSILFDRYWFVLFKTAGKYIKDQERCEEAVHDLFLNIWTRRKYLNINNVNSYLKASIRYQVYRILRQEKSSAVTYIAEYSEEAGAGHENDGDKKMLQFELQKELEQCLKGLPKRTAEIFLLSRKEHLSNAEIADKLEISKRSVENQITKALQFLRNNYKYVVVFLLLLHRN